jgi:hypothetical protein
VKSAFSFVCLSGFGGAEVEYKPLPSGPSNGIQKDTKGLEVRIPW